MGDAMARERHAQRGADLHARIFELLLDKVRQDTYPSTTRLAMLEQMLRDQDEVEAYAEALMDKAGSDACPSLDHLRRLQGLA
jgi:uncharacterized protein (DUF2342 family)